MNRFELVQKQKEAEASLVAASMMQQMGVTSGELTYARASQVYGAWFRDHVKDGTLTPVRYGGGSGERVTKYFSVVRILSLKAAEYESLARAVEPPLP